MSFRLIYRPIPETDTPGVPDPRVVQTWLDARTQNPGVTLEDQRQAMGWPNADLSGPRVTTDSLTLPGRWGPIGAKIYRPSGAGPLPAVVYFHGGGFFGGSVKTVENPCRFLAERAGAVVISVDYSLAPEHPFPRPLEDCWDAVKAVHEQAASLGIDVRWIAVAGDSAGGNLAAACSILDRQEPRLIAAQLLIYPVVDLRSEEEGHLPWSEDEYEVKAFHDLVWGSIRGLRDAGPFLDKMYLAGHSGTDPLASPLVHPVLSDFPPTLVVTAEFDFLRVEGEEFARRLSAAGVYTRAVRYRGMDHAFFDKLGLFPQAADVVEQMASFLTSVTEHSAAEQRLEAQMTFLLEIDKLKRIVRRNELSDGSRRENTAEHSWHLVMFALTLSEHAAPGLNLGRAVTLCALHDLVEIDAGDTFFWDEKGYQDKEDRERAAAKRLFGMLPAPQASEFEALWEEFEEGSTPEALFANAVDRLAPVLLNSHSGGRSWRENGVTAAKIREKMTVIAQASPRLGRVLESLIANAEKKGFLGSEASL